MFALLLLLSVISAEKVIGKKLINYNYHFYKKDVCYTNVWAPTTYVKMIINNEGKIINETHTAKDCKDAATETKDISEEYEYHEIPKHLAYAVFHFTGKKCPYENAAPNLLLFEGCIEDTANQRSCSYTIKDKIITEKCVKGEKCQSTEIDKEAQFKCDVCTEHVYTYSDDSTVTEYLTTYCKQFFQNGSILTTILITVLALMLLF